MKLKLYDGRDFYNTVDVLLKLDGVQAIRKGDIVVSRKDKPLYNLPLERMIEGVPYEVYCGDFDLTRSIVRTHEHTYKVEPDELFSLDPVDGRLILESLTNPTATEIKAKLKKVLDTGFEGLVLHEHTPKGIVMWKVKPHDTYDIRVTGIIPGKGRHEGKLGALITTMGKVGTGFTDVERQESWEIGEIIEVECMQLTPAGKFRHPRFKRRRFDKDTENKLR